MWHILPYPQLLELLGMTEGELALILKEEDFLAEKLRDKPICEPVRWRELTDAEKEQTAKIKELMQTVDITGKKPFDFEYSVPKIDRAGKEVFKTGMIYAFSGLYQHAFDVPSEVYLLDEQLAAYHDLGVNGIWTQGVLSGLVEFPFEPSLSKGHEERLARMRALTERLDKYGIKLYLYIWLARLIASSNPRSIRSDSSAPATKAALRMQRRLQKMKKKSHALCSIK